MNMPLDPARFDLPARLQFPQIDDVGALRSHAQTDGSEKTREDTFKNLLQGLVNHVDTLQQDAGASIRGLATGETTNIHDVTVKMEEAGIAFDLMMQVRNKLMEAYQELIKMQG